MTPTNLPEANGIFHAPQGDESRVASIHVYQGEIKGGSCDGFPVIVTAWKPNVKELEDLQAGKPVYIGFVTNGLPPHILGTTFESVTKLA
jgi:hypothetical protein